MSCTEGSVVRWQQSLGPVLDNVGKSISQIFAPESKSPSRKAGRLDESRASSPMDGQPFSRPQCQWLAGAVNDANRASTMALATAVDSRFQAVETEQERQNQTLQTLVKDFADLKVTVEDNDIKHSNVSSQMRHDHDTARASGAASSSSGQPDPWQAYINSKGQGKGVKHELSDEWSGLWILGNLGYDMDRDTLLTRGREIFNSLVDMNFQAEVKDMRTKPRSKLGSQLIVEFHSSAEIEKWSDKIYAIQKVYPENSAEARRGRGQRSGGTVFLSKELTERQTRPGTIRWRCFKECQRLEETVSVDQRTPVNIERGAKQVYVNNLLVGFSEYGKWQWTVDGQKYFKTRGAIVEAVTASIERNW